MSVKACNVSHGVLALTHVLTSHALEERDGVVHEGLEVLDVAALPLGLAVALHVDPEHGVPRLREPHAGRAHEHAALHPVT